MMRCPYQHQARAAYVILDNLPELPFATNPDLGNTADRVTQGREAAWTVASVVLEGLGGKPGGQQVWSNRTRA